MLSQTHGPCVTTYMRTSLMVWMCASVQTNPRRVSPNAASTVRPGTRKSSHCVQALRVSLPLYLRLNSSQHGPIRAMPRYSDRAPHALGELARSEQFPGIGCAPPCGREHHGAEGGGTRHVPPPQREHGDEDRRHRRDECGGQVHAEDVLHGRVPAVGHARRLRRTGSLIITNRLRKPMTGWNDCLYVSPCEGTVVAGCDRPPMTPDVGAARAVYDRARAAGRGIEFAF